MSIDYLADAWKRLDWADADGKALVSRIRAFQQLDPYGLWVEPDGYRWKAELRRFIDPSEEVVWLDELARLLGSFLDHSRAALNYVAVQLGFLAIRKDPSLAGPSLAWIDQLHPAGLEFPIFRKAAKFNSGNHIRKLPDEMYNALEAVQPYPGRDRDGLWYLNELAAQYRHSIVHPVSMWPLNERHRVLIDGHAIPTKDIEVVSTNSLKDGDVVLYFALPSALPDAHVDPRIAIGVGIDSPDFAGKDLMETINSITGAVGPVMNSLETEFFA